MNDATYPIISFLRHAKAENPTMNMQDFDRPLSNFGKKQANRVGEHIVKKIKQPIFVLCSPALRTRQTLENLNLKKIVKIEYIDGLYSGNMGDYLSAIKDNFHTPLLVIGHNPTIAQTAYSLWDRNEKGQKFPVEYETASLTIFSIPKNNNDDLMAKASLLDVFRP